MANEPTSSESGNKKRYNKIVDSEVFGSLPLLLVARCVSYNVESVADLTKFRLVNKSFGRILRNVRCNIGHEVEFSKRKNGHLLHAHLACPPKQIGDEKSFVTRLMVGSRHNLFQKHLWKTHQFSDDEILCEGGLFPGKVEIKEMTHLWYEKYDFSEPSKSTVLAGQLDGAARLFKLKETLSSLRNILGSKNKKHSMNGDSYDMSHADRNSIIDQVKAYRLADPSKEPDSSIKPKVVSTEALVCKPVCFLTLKVDKDASCITGRTSLNGLESVSEGEDSRKVTKFLRLQANDELLEFSSTHPVAISGFGCEYDAMVMDSDDDDHGYHEVILLCKVIENIVEMKNWCNKRLGKSATDLYDKFQNEEKFVEGVVIVDRFIEDKKMLDRLNSNIDHLLTAQDVTGMALYHPESNNIVRYIVDPSVYPYVARISPHRANKDDAQPCDFARPMGDRINPQREHEDFWHRQHNYFDSQWLPTYFGISRVGRCTIRDYISNLTPTFVQDPTTFTTASTNGQENDNAAKHIGTASAWEENLSTLFEQCLPYIESVYSYARGVRPFVRWSSKINYFGLSDIDGSVYEKCSFRNQALQVITKIVDYKLKPGQNYEEEWHVVGEPDEDIILTCLYIMDRDENVGGGDLFFKRAFFDDEAGFICGTAESDRSDELNVILDEGLVPLGKVTTRKGRLIVFPNCHVHKVGEMVHKMNETSQQENGDGGPSVENTVARQRMIFSLLSILVDE